MNEILQGVEYIHNQGVLHLDLKPENILCLSRTSFKIKIIDFGLARFYDGKEICVLFGTPEFVSPEVISYEPVSPAADMWSIGVICYVMLSGLSPFMGDSQGETLANIMKVTYDFNYPEFAEISEEARDFIRRLLVKDPRRCSRFSILSLPSSSPKRQQLKRKGTVSKKRLKHFVYRRKWQKAVNAIIALQRMGVVLHHPCLPEQELSGIQPSNTLIDSSRAPDNKIIIQPQPTPVESPVTQSPKTKSRRKSLKSMNRSLFGRLTTKRLLHSDSLGSEDSSSSPASPSPPNTSRRPSILSKLGWNPSGSNASKTATGNTPSIAKSSASVNQEHMRSPTPEKRKKKKSGDFESTKMEMSSSQKDKKGKTATVVGKSQETVKSEAPEKISASVVLKDTMQSSKPMTFVAVTSVQVDSKQKNTSTEQIMGVTRHSDGTNKENYSEHTKDQNSITADKKLFNSTEPRSKAPFTVELKRTPVKPNSQKPTHKRVVAQGTSIASRIGFFSNLTGKPDSKP
ncbi:unnamed protein product [Echinostoma caproni]|uniref:Protein kinase domain-containing protein n=1 Tax=Echinostoma caproni TaxID=27848 RepID=A0A183ANA1_9TREM|nr:unnamed protein product [Echinostoma caproni]